MTHRLALAPLVLVLCASPALADSPPAEETPAKAAATPASPEAHPMLSSTQTSLSNEPVEMSRYQGKVLLIVNVASNCGYTPQYDGLQALHEKYESQGLAVLGFPANDFGAQEPGTNEEIATFCKKNYGVSFPMFAKISVHGDDKAPLYAWLTHSNSELAGDVKWNFEKFLVGRDGSVIARFPSKVLPDAPELTKAIEAALAAKS